TKLIPSIPFRMYWISISPEGIPSGLIEIQYILKGIEGISFVYFTERDVVRHPIVQEIIRAYERAESKREEEFDDYRTVKGEEEADKD
ncbi:MAG: hypothetical protein DRG31_03320, partial [Deltaproteobacteria bacterium]